MGYKTAEERKQQHQQYFNAAMAMLIGGVGLLLIAVRASDYNIGFAFGACAVYITHWLMRL